MNFRKINLKNMGTYWDLRDLAIATCRLAFEVLSSAAGLAFLNLAIMEAEGLEGATKIPAAFSFFSN